MTTHAQRVEAVCENMDVAHGIAANQHAQLELTTKLLEQIGALEAEVKGLKKDLDDCQVRRATLRHQLDEERNNADDAARDAYRAGRENGREKR